MLAAESQSMDQSQSEERVELATAVIPESDMDTQPSVDREVMTPAESVHTEPVSPPPSREGSEMPQVSQSQEVC